MNRFMPSAPLVRSVVQWLTGRSCGLSAPGISTASNQSGCMVSPPSTNVIGWPRSGSTRCAVKAADPGPKSVAERLGRIDGHVGNLGARGRHQAVEERLLRLDADVGRRHEERHHVLVEQRILALEREAAERAIDRRADRTPRQPVCRPAAAPVRRCWATRTHPRSRPLLLTQPSRYCADPVPRIRRSTRPAESTLAGSMRGVPAVSHHASISGEVKLPLHRLEQLEHLRGVPRRRRACVLSAARPAAGAQVLDRRFDEVVVAPLQQRRRRVGVVATAAGRCRAERRRGWDGVSCRILTRCSPRQGV